MVVVVVEVTVSLSVAAIERLFSRILSVRCLLLKACWPKLTGLS